MKITWEQVKEWYAEINGDDAANDVARHVYEAVEHYLELNMYELEDVKVKGIALTTLDVLRLAYDGEFKDLW
jgi:hypothetical protein